MRRNPALAITVACIIIFTFTITCRSETRRVRSEAVAVRGDLRLRGEYTLAPADFRLDTWKPLLDQFAAEGKNYIYWWGSAFFHSKRYPDALFYKDRKGNYMSHDEIHELIRYSHSKGIKFYMAVGGFAWLTMNTLAELYPETRAVGSTGMCPTNRQAHEINVTWIEELYQTFPEMDGVMIELRDENGMCNCDVCRVHIDKYGSQKYGQGELQFLREVSDRLWKVNPKAEIVVCIGYGEHKSHNNDVAFYEGIKALGTDPRWIWLEVRGHWELPGAGGVLRPLRYFSRRVVAWYQPEYANADDMAAWVRRAAKEGLEGVCLGREVGSWSLLYSIREGNAYLAHSLRKDLSHFTFNTVARDPGISDAALRRTCTEEFYGSAGNARDGDALFYLDDLLLRAALGSGPAGNFYAAEPRPVWEQIRRAAGSAGVAAMNDAQRTELYERTRAIQRIAAEEGGKIRAIDRRLRTIAARVPQQKQDSFALVRREVHFLKQMLGLSESDSAALADAHAHLAADTPVERRRVVATSQANNTNFSALSLFDGNPETQWICRNSSGTPQSVTVQLPAAKTIDQVTLAQAVARLDYNTDRYRIEGSADGVHFDSWVEGRLPLAKGSARTHQIGKRARFVRIVVLSIHPDAAFSSPSLSEVEIVAGGRPVREWLRE